jgi:exo-1,4-beta-D-glucosaminidase
VKASSRWSARAAACAALLATWASTTAAADPAVITLERGWTLQSSAKVPEGGAVLSTAAYEPKGWYAVTVPSTVVAAQVAAGEFPDPYFGMNLRKLPGMTYPIGLNSFANVPMDKDSPYARSWWYRTEIALPPEWKGRTIWLRLDGVNYRANVWMNGRQVADAKDVAGAYRLHELDVTSFVAATGKNVLAVETFAPTEKELGINWVDWNPTPPDKDMGLWREVSVAASGPVSVRHPYVVTRFPAGSLARADLTVAAEVRNASPQPVTGVLEAVVAGRPIRQEVRLEPRASRSIRFEPGSFPELTIEKPELWWPAEMGSPVLHDLTVRFTIEGVPSDEQHARFGIREVTSEITEEGYRLFRVNGQRILVRGGAWANDLLLRPLSPRALATHFEYIRDLRLNTVRLEAQLGSDAFFDLADEKGVLLLAGWCCCDIWEGWDKWTPRTLEVATESLRTQMLRLRGHPSLMGWLTGSDGPPPEAVERAYRRTAEQAGWPNPIVSSAADVPTKVSGPSGVKMTGPYDYEPPSYWLTANVPAGKRPELDNARYGGAFGFNTETGPGPAIPPLESLRKMLPAEHLWPFDEVWSYHSAGERFQKLDRFREAMDATYGRAATLEDFLRKAQAMAYDGQRAMFEAYGRNKYTATGVVQWMLNNAWPSISWHLYDYYLYPAGGYFGAKKAGEPLHVQYSYDDRSVVVVSTRREASPGLVVSARVYDFDLRELFTREAKADAPPDSSTRVFVLPPPPETKDGVFFVALSLRDADGRETSANFYWLPAKLSRIAWDKTDDTAFAPIAEHEDLTALARLPRVRLDATGRVERRKDGDRVRVTVRNPTKSLAFQVHVGVRSAGSPDEALPVLWEDNYLSLLPGESKEIAAWYPEPGTLGDDPRLVVDGWNVEPSEVALPR